MDKSMKALLSSRKEDRSPQDLEITEEQTFHRIWKNSARIENPFKPDHFHDKNHANLILEHRGMKSHESARSRRETTRIYGFLASRDFADLYQVIPGSCRIKFAWKSI